MRATTRSFAPLTLVVLASLVLTAGEAGAEDRQATYPSPGGSTFTSDSEGWRDGGASCNLLGIRGLLCTARNEHQAAEGNPAGAIRTRFQALVNAVGLFTGEGTWRSPAFRVEALPDGAAIAGGDLHFDRRAAIEALIDIGGIARYRVLLVDETDATAPRTVEIANAALTKDDAGWRSVDVALSASQIEAGRTYHLAFVSQMTSQTAQLLSGQIWMGWDNVRLTVRSGPEGPAGPAGAGAGDRVGGSDVNSRRAKRLLRIDTRRASAARRGQFSNEVRVRVFCKRTSLSRCEGTAKLRTAQKVNPSIRRRRAKRRVTFGSQAYVCPRGMVCFIKVPIRDRTRRWAAVRGDQRGLAADVLVTVLDEEGVQQTLRRRIRVYARR